MNEIDQLAAELRYEDGNARRKAIIAFKFFRGLAKQQVIDWDILNAILKDAGED